VEFIKDWWGVFLGFFISAMWLGRLQQIVQDLKNKVFVTKELCEERQAGCGKINALQFSQGEKQFAEMKTLLEQFNEENQKRFGIILDRYDAIMQTIVDMKRK